MGIAGMVVWVLTAGIGVCVLAGGAAAHRRQAGPAAAPPGMGPGVQAEADDGASVIGAAALALVVSGEPAGGPAVEGSPLLEFMHPALALVGLTFWIFFVMTGDRVFAWIAFGVVVATVTAGLSWEAARRRKAAGRAGPQGPEGTQCGQRGQAAGFPARLVVLHALAAACTFALVVIGALAASH